ncbi:basement membrane-specific heparan sulfate proteoglycan core protein-like [Danio rerio]|uniref:Basement membrane-specific heparan sulfate proteoglycan core protein-like n=1 Tax=Danio rerio TaxID=7955 RepID=A0AC58G2W9_DANRE
MGSSALPLLLLLISILDFGLTEDIPTPTVTVTPDSAVFIRETVNLKCVIESDHSDWTYEWYKDSKDSYLQFFYHHTVNGDTLTISGADWSDQGQYWCKAWSSGRLITSNFSSEVHLSVKALPRSTVTVTPDSAVFTGETVNLKCVIESDHSDWTYEWYKDSVKLQSDGHYTINRDTLTIRGAAESDQGWHRCKGLIDRSSVSLKVSSLYLSVNASPRSTVTVTPDSAVFTGETVNLTCVIESDHSDWTYKWYKDRSVKLQSDGHYTVNRNTLTLRGAAESDQGQYWCKGQRSGRPNSSQSSSAVSLSVKASPRSTVTVTPDSAVFTGETVNLKCVIESDHSDWTYKWYKYRNRVKLQSDGHYTVNRDTLTIRGAAESDQGQYWCKGQRSGRPNSSQSSSAVSLSVKALPRSTVTVTPDSPVFTGETVNLTCVIESDHSDWTYEWYKYRNRVKLQSDGRYTVNRDTLTIRGAAESDQGQYWCKGQRSGRPNSSQSSSAVSLSVRASPRSTVTVTPDSAVFTGETVNLTCVIESDHSDWTYKWYKYRNRVKLQSDGHYTVNRDTLTIRGAAESDQGQYWCKGQRSGRPNSSQSSSAVSLSVKASPRSTVTVTPDSAEFTGETVNLTCVIKSDHSDWTYEWYKDSVKLQSDGHYTVNRDTLTIRGAAESDQGQYWCKGQRSGRPNSSQSSSAVSLSVKASPRSTVTVTPDSPVFTGETVNLKCVIESDHSDWTYEWYKDRNSVKLQSDGHYTVNRDTLTIRGAAESDQGQYWCKGQRSGRPNSSQSSSAVSLSVKASGQISVYKIVSFLLAVSVYLLATAVLIYKYIRARVPSSTEEKSQLAVTEEETSI